MSLTRCLDCGSPRTADQCPSCGLTSIAAELLFRRRLVARTAIFLVGSLAFPYVSQIYPPLDLDLMLVFFGILFFLALAIAVILESRARQHKETGSPQAHLRGIHSVAVDSGGNAFCEWAARFAEKPGVPSDCRGEQVQHEGDCAREPAVARAFVAAWAEGRAAGRGCG